ncbi:uncharacterized protein LOC108252543, partial [Diaphorina citri]|uniref:Uncharacterized protein LOC108252543 n=1 Tax=Diaphorina citri TaxID=121845 RepID=A0A1S4ED08_DIACI
MAWRAILDFLWFSTDAITPEEGKRASEEGKFRKENKTKVAYVIIITPNVDTSLVVFTLQGRVGVKRYMSSFWSELRGMRGILSGNSDTATVVTHRLLPLIFATKVRILPYSLHRRTVCLRMEVLGCLARGTTAPVSNEKANGRFREALV